MTQMIFRNLDAVEQDGRKDITIKRNKIASITDPKSTGVAKDFTLTFENALVFPGLINSHDHLDFNLFPRLGNRQYKNYREWGDDIHRQQVAQIERIRRIPQHLRTQWGVYKNLLNGITTVVNHGKKLSVDEELITVVQPPVCIHSLAGENNWKVNQLKALLRSGPVVLHLGEGTDEISSAEVAEYIHWNKFKKRTIAVHGVAMNEQQAKHFKALIWCPDSNYFLLNATAPVDRLKMKTKILFGTDSGLTASNSVWEQLRIARASGLLSDHDLFESITRSPAEVWKLTKKGTLAKGQWADLVIARKKNNLWGHDAFFNLNMNDLLLVMHRGQISLFDEDLYPELMQSALLFENFHPITVHGSKKFVKGDLPKLVKTIRSYDPSIKLPFADW